MFCKYVAKVRRGTERMIEKERIEQIKRSVDLGALMRSRGIELRKNGKGLKGRCPFHEDKTPSLSINPKENLWQCFGCGAAGDAIRFVELFDKVSFRQAVEKLLDGADVPARTGAAQPVNDAPAPSARSVKLLLRVIDFYHTAFPEDGRAREYLASRGIADNNIFSSYRIGFANGTLRNVLPEDGDVTRALKEIGVLNDSGGEFFYGCAIVPLFDANGNPAGLYGRRIDGMDTKGPDHLYLPGERRGLFNREAAKSSREIILCEAIIDSLTLLSARIHNTIPCYGTNGFTPEHLELLKQRGVELVHIAFDADESGRKAAGILASRLEAEGFAARQVDLPEGEDVNSFFSSTADAKQKFMELVSEANPEDAVSDLLSVSSSFWKKRTSSS
jgi:DNA primase catalytic core